MHMDGVVISQILPLPHGFKQILAGENLARILHQQGKNPHLSGCQGKGLACHPGSQVIQIQFQLLVPQKWYGWEPKSGYTAAAEPLPAPIHLPAQRVC